MQHESPLRGRPDDLHRGKSSGLDDAEYGLNAASSQSHGQNGTNGGGAAHPSTSLTTAARWRCTLCLLATFLAVFHNLKHSNFQLESVVTRVQNKIRQDNGAPLRQYEPLVGTDGQIYEDLGGRHVGDRLDAGGDHGARPAADEVEKPWISRGKMEMEKANHITEEQQSPPSPGAGKSVHPRVVCLPGFYNAGISGCRSLVTKANNVTLKNLVPSIPKQPQRKKGGKSENSSEDVTDVREGETEECKLSDPSYQTLPAAPSTCNDVHALAFRFGPTLREARPRRAKDVYPSRHEIKYLTSGGFRSVWAVRQLDDNLEGDTRVIMKTNQMRRGWNSYYLDQNRRDILISERAGGSVAHSNLLPVHQYCAFSSVVPFATAGVLDDYIDERTKKGDILSAEEQYRLATMAARGLHQTHVYHDGKATFVHADVKPAQFLLIDPPRSKNKNATTSMPVMQINDFNRGKFLTRNVRTNETCPFRMCHVHHKGSLFRSPEEYKKCADQSDRIDVFSLGGLFYYILSDGEKPWYYVGNYEKAVERILKGEKPRLPKAEEYKDEGKEVVARVRERSKHPLFVALKEVMMECWAFEPKDRPSSLRVVHMLEEKRREINSPNAKSKGGLQR